jgi:lipopolysaccharide assembly protein A
MQFLKTLFWIALTVVLVLFAKANWNAVTLKLWGGLEADVKLPILVLFAFLLGFLPTFILYRTRLWGLKRRLEPAERHVSAVPPPATPTPVAVDNGSDGRVATDSKAWPTA